MGARPVNLLVFREDRAQVHSQSARADLLRACEEDVLSALLLAGETECGVADAAPELACGWQRVTDSFAGVLIRGAASCDSDGIPPLMIQSLPAPEILTISPPEGFAYYALHPLAYADLLNHLGSFSDEVAVVGIRSIGTTLSAITSAAARKKGLLSSRITVRPHGHPYNRQTQFPPEQLAWIEEKRSAGAAFLVVDEGPGLSGSSFIATAEALVAAGIPASGIVLICGHQPDFDSLRAENAAIRARQFRWIAVNSEPYRPAGQKFAGGGEWRRLLFADQASWPASWTSFERLKYLTSGDGVNPSLLKFMGFGHHGTKVVAREALVAEVGFGPALHYEDAGFARYPWIQGRPMQAEGLSESTLKRLAEYCAFRARAFAAEIKEITALQQMAEHNLSEFKLDLPVTLRLKHPVIADGRMQPHEWLITSQGQMLKSDSGSHGDDHFFPGPTDIAWDLAGAIVEWRMSSAAQEFFLSAYRRVSGDDARPRLSGYLTAYAAFRAGYCTMAANASCGAERERLEQAALQYRSRLVRPREAAAVY